MRLKGFARIEQDSLRVFTLLPRLMRTTLVLSERAVLPANDSFDIFH